MQEALRRYKEEVAADPDTDSGFYYNTNVAFGTRQYVLVRSFPAHDLESVPCRSTFCVAFSGQIALSVLYSSAVHLPLQTVIFDQIL